MSKEELKRTEKLPTLETPFTEIVSLEYLEDGDLALTLGESKELTTLKTSLEKTSRDKSSPCGQARSINLCCIWLRWKIKLNLK